MSIPISNTINKTYLCKEGSEFFNMKALNIEDAKDKALMYNAIVIGEAHE